MKATIHLVSFIFLFVLVACGGSATEGQKVEAKEAKVPTTETAASADADLKTFNVNKGTLTWTGSKVIGNSSHTGTINIPMGDLKAVGGEITSGQFVVDMNSINCTDLTEDDGKGKLEGHLKSADFFDVENNPRATFLLTGAAPLEGQADATHSITGNLTLRGVSKSITFPAKVTIADNKLMATSPSFTIDRTQWGIEYGSGSIVGLAKDKVISNDIALELSLEAVASAPVQ
ncbi:MAG: YceI family protein [Bacteroidota bacterium]